MPRRDTSTWPAEWRNGSIGLIATHVERSCFIRVAIRRIYSCPNKTHAYVSFNEISHPRCSGWRNTDRNENCGHSRLIPPNSATTAFRRMYNMYFNSGQLELWIIRTTWFPASNREHKNKIAWSCLGIYLTNLCITEHPCIFIWPM